MFSTKVNNSSANELTAAELLWVQTGATGVLELLEGAAPSHTSGTGKLYVKSSDSKLYFKNDSGTEFDLTAAAAGANTALSNLASVAINTTLVSDTDNTDSLGTAAISWSDLFLGSGAVITFSSAPSTPDVTITHGANSLAFAGASSGYTFDDKIMPSANDGAALGTPTTSWADLFLASGGVIGWNNSDVLITHSANMLTLSGGDLTLPSAGLIVGASTPFSDAAGTLTLQNVDALDATTEATIEAAIDTLANLTSVQGRTITLADAGADAILGWDDSANAYQNLSAADARAALGLATTDSPQFTAINVGAATDTTISRVSAGVIAVEGNNVILANTAANRTIILTAAGGKPTTTSGCAAATVVEAGTNDVDYWVLDFDATTKEYAFWNVVMPDNYDGGTITARFIWTTTSSTTTHTVVWGLQARAFGNDDAIDQAFGTTQEVSDDVLAAADVHITAATSAITIGGTPAGGKMVVFRAYRDPANASDDLNVDARLIAIQIEYGINAYSD